MTVPVRVNCEKLDALKDVHDVVNEYGEDIILYFRKENNISRDKYNSIISESTMSTNPPTIPLKAMPVDHQPNRQQMEKAGIREQCECIAWLAMYDILANNLTMEDFEDEKCTVSVDGMDYGIRDKSKVTDFADQHLYLCLGLYKR